MQSREKLKFVKSCDRCLDCSCCSAFRRCHCCCCAGREALPSVRRKSLRLPQACARMRCTRWCPSTRLLKGPTRRAALCGFQHRSGTATAPLKSGGDASLPVLTQQGGCLWRFSSLLCPGGFKARLARPRKALNPPHRGLSWVRALPRGKPARFAESIARATGLWIEKSRGSGGRSSSV